ncbi:hypothetical protein F2P56_008414 [Juglans regia]|uniref:Uncharacterized protein LOC109000195 n=2 Tax=Juglans regia TaxID=51240 RepID=A0A2I4FLN6_JUGRE|nr:uncharacterized protein LOC109000195 [Juglans regia]KAF5471637.1 hypothetical protein F2P56_008414 [Juglans regia]
MQYLPSVQHDHQQATFLDQVWLVLDRGNATDLTMFFLIGWSLWNRRNKMMMEKIVIDPLAAVNHALSLQKTFIQLKTSNAMGRGKLCKWKPPPPGFLKLNVDGAMFADVGKSGIGVVLRDEAGQVVMAATKKEDFVDEPATIELLAVLRGLQFFLSLGIPNLVVESDCLVVVQELQDSQESLSSNGNLIQDVKRLMQLFRNSSVQHVYRDGNGVAHTLARYAWNVDDVQMWWDAVPAFVTHALWFDQIDM